MIGLGCRSSNAGFQIVKLSGLSCFSPSSGACGGPPIAGWELRLEVVKHAVIEPGEPGQGLL